MGIERSSLEYLLAAKKSGVDFSETITLGRQDFLVKPNDFSGLLNKWGVNIDSESANKILHGHNGYADGLFELLGGQKARAADHSGYEGADIILDLNSRLPESLHCSCKLLFDGGTLEHVFNFPQAMKNAMEMVRPGGHLISITPSNNMMGHGFYQFSPELFYRVLSPENGFVVESMFINIGWGSGDWFEVRDPNEVKHRVGRMTGNATNIYVRARRVEVREIFSTTPYQSDYSSAWSEGTDRSDPGKRLEFFNSVAPKKSILKSGIRKVIPRAVMNRLTEISQTMRRINSFDSGDFVCRQPY